METPTVEPGNDPMHEQSEKTINASGGFLPPGRMRSRRRSGLSAANETIMTTAKIARYAQKPRDGDRAGCCKQCGGRGDHEQACP
jgi:hypothetical protein